METANRFPKSVSFEPWVGEKYDFGISGRKVLLVAESCYTWKDEDGVVHTPTSKHTTDLIQWRLNGNEMRFLTNIESTFSEAIPALSSVRDFWHSVALYEFVQRPMVNVNQRPTSSDWRQAWEPFKAVVRELRPDCTFVLGYTMWKNLPPEQYKETLVAEYDEELWCCGYDIGPGLEALKMFRLHHPSRNYNRKSWSRCVGTALAL